jgi:hypothetical protein
MKSKWVATEAEQKAADKRMARVMRIPNYFTRGQSVFQKTGTLKCADWLHFLTTGILYVLSPLLSGKAGLALTALVRALRLAVSATSDRDPLARPEDDFARRQRECQDLKLKIVGFLCVYEAGAPISELPPVLHVLLHVPDAIYRWNSVRNMWCFFNERQDITDYFIAI